MIRIAVLGDIGSGKSYVAKQFGYPVLNADVEVAKLYKKNRNKKFVILDIPLLIENKINKKNDILIFVEAKKKEISKRLKKRHNLNLKILKKLKKFQLPLELKKKKADFIIKNNFKNNSIKKNAKRVLGKILLNA